MRSFRHAQDPKAIGIADVVVLLSVIGIRVEYDNFGGTVSVAVCE